MTTKLSVIDAVASSVDRVPQAPAYEDDHTTLSYHELWTLGLAASRRLRQAGMTPGSKVAILLADRAPALIALIGIWMTGAIAVPVNRTQKADKLSFILDQCDSHLILISDEQQKDPERPDTPYLVWPESFETDVTLPAPHDNPETRDAMILYTSGTTGVPKGVLHTHRALTLNALEMSAALGMDASDRIFLNIPFCFSNAVSHVLMALFHGACLCVHNGFLFGDALIDAVKTRDITGFAGVPAHYVRITDMVESPVESRLRFLMNSGDHLPINVLRRLLELFPHTDIHCVYGISECAPRVCSLEPSLLPQKLGSVGRPLPSTTVTVRDEDQSLLPTGELGEVYVESGCLMKGYYANPTANEKYMTEHGFRTGDLGYLDPDGCLFLTGRMDSVFKSAGEKVSCRLIEETLRDTGTFSTLIKDTVVIASDDHHLGKVPHVYFVKNQFDEKAFRSLRREVKKALPRNHEPGEYISVREIPRSPSGKLIRVELLESSNLEPDN